MQVQLKQPELVNAVRQFLTKQGINLDGKDVDVKFSATRGDAGIVATVDIEDANIPGLTVTEHPGLAVIRNLAPIVTTSLSEQSQAAANSEAPSDAGVGEGAAETPAASEKKSSLFNS